MCKFKPTIIYLYNLLLLHLLLLTHSQKDLKSIIDNYDATLNNVVVTSELFIIYKS